MTLTSDGEHLPTLSELFYNTKSNQIDVVEKIHRLRRKVLLHSVIYYNFNTTIVSDATYDAWARELGELQDKYPEASEEVYYFYEEFKDFSGSTTGFNLPLGDEETVYKAHKILERSYK